MHRSDGHRFGSWPTALVWTDDLGMRMKDKAQSLQVINKTNKIVIAIKDRCPRRSNRCNEHKSMMTLSFRLKTLGKTLFLYTIKVKKLKRKINSNLPCKIKACVL
jgi:hypothetical protein